MKEASPLISGISRVLQKLLKYCIGTTVLTFFLLSLLGVLRVIFPSDLNNSESAQLLFRSSL